MRSRWRSRAVVMVVLVTITSAMVMLARVPSSARNGTPGPLAAVDFIDAWTNDDGTGGDGDDGGPVGTYDLWGAASSADPSEAGPAAPRYDKDVGRCTATVRATDPNFVDLLVENGYPHYVCTVNVMVENGSVLPATVSPAVITADANLAVGAVLPQLPATLSAGEQGEAAFSVQVLQPAAQNATLHATIAITFTAEYGRILVDKVTDAPGSPLLFEFAPDWDDNFFLADEDTPYDSGPLYPGEYSVEEINLPEDWILTGASCVVDGVVGGTAMDPSEILVGPGETVICTFENFDTGQLEPNPSLIIIKDARPADDTVFWFDGGSLPSFSLQDPSNSTEQFTELEPGAYTITELDVGLDETWQFDEVVCDALDWSAVGPAVTVNLTQGEVAVCTFYNAEELPPTGAPAWAIPVGAGSLTALLGGLLLVILWRRRREAEN